MKSFLDSTSLLKPESSILFPISTNPTFQDDSFVSEWILIEPPKSLYFQYLISNFLSWTAPKLVLCSKLQSLISLISSTNHGFEISQIMDTRKPVLKTFNWQTRQKRLYFQSHINILKLQEKKQIGYPELRVEDMTTGDIRNMMVIDLPKPKLNLVAAFNLFLMIIHGFLFLLTATWNNDYGSLTWFSFHRRTTFKLSWELSHTRVQNFIWLTFMMIKKNLEQLSNKD